MTVPTRSAVSASVWVSPNRQGGAPCIDGTRMPTAQVAHLVWQGGLPVMHLGWPYLTDEQCLAACWFEVVHGDRRKWRKRFADWPKGWVEDEWRNRAATLAEDPA